MIATLLVVLFALVALASAATLADAVVRGRNAIRLLRGDLARIDALREVTVRFEGKDAWKPMPVLRPVSVRGARGSRRVVWTAQPLRAAA